MSFVSLYNRDRSSQNWQGLPTIDGLLWDSWKHAACRISLQKPVCTLCTSAPECVWFSQPRYLRFIPLKAQSIPGRLALWCACPLDLQLLSPQLTWEGTEIRWHRLAMFSKRHCEVLFAPVSVVKLGSTRCSLMALAELLQHQRRRLEQ